MSNTSALGAIEYAAETTFAESSTTFDALRLPVIGQVDPSGLNWEKQAPDFAEQYLQGGHTHILMGQSGSFKTKLDLAGHGSTTVGSPSVTAIETFLGYVFGNVSGSIPASTTLTGGTATVPVTSVGDLFGSGQLCRIGAVNDTRGNGQFHAISSHSGTTLTLLTGMNGAPSNGDVVAGACMLYPHETPPAAGINATVPGLRFRLLTANLQYSCHGCFPTAVSLTGLNSGERPQIEITWQVSRWSAVSATFPSTLSTSRNLPAPIAAGSLFVADVGTATRAVRSYRSFSIEYTLGMAPLMGPGGVSAYQTVIGCRRLPSQIKVSWVEEADAATATPVTQGYGTSETNKHVLWTGSTIAGKAIAIYMPNVCISNVPVQFADGGINRMRVEGMAHTGSPAIVTDLTASAFRLAFA